MAWNAAGAWKKPLNLAKKNDDSSFPGLKPTNTEVAAKIQYEELQQDEVVALEAIYGVDFIRQKETQTWKKSEPSFDIRIRASSNDDFAVTLGVVLTATYPKTPPLLTLKGQDELQDSTQFKIQKFLEIRPKEFAADEQPMVDGIVEGIREILEDAAQASAAGLEMPSLEEERTAHEAMMAKKAQELKAAEERKKLEETKEEERVLESLLQEELKRQKEKAKEYRKQQNRSNGASQYGSEDMRVSGEFERVTFDQPCKVTDKTGNAVHFTAVTGKTELRKGPLTTIYLVRAVVPAGQDCPNLILKETPLRSSGKDATQFKKQLQALEAQLDTLKKVRHRNLVDILDFKIDRNPSTTVGSSSSLWTVSVLSPEAEKGPLEELLDLAGTLDISKVRSWTTDLLDALGFLHNNSLVHQSIHPGNVLLFREPTGNIVPKLADAAYQKELHNICLKSQSTPGLSLAKSAYWLPPEIAGSSKPHYTQKTDVWDFGIVVLQMIFGMDVPQKYHSPTALMESLSLSNSLYELISKFFKPDPKKRPRAFELSSSEFLATDAPVLVDDASMILSSVHSLSSMQQGVPTRLRRESMTRNMAASRYREDFVEEGRLGKGGFGEVVKARKKLDGQIYAIKKITQRSQASLTEILKEVRLLSQLSHPAVVRYYNTWLEEIHDFGDSEGDTSTEDLTTEESKDINSQDHAIEFATSTGGLDFMSSSGFPQVEFGYDDEEEGEEEDDDDESDAENDDESASEPDDQPQQGQMIDIAPPGSPEMQRRARFQRPFRTVLYISMEYCEKRTLRDLISRGLHKNTAEIWRLFRQILEGLAHIHGLSIVHRDLKPENIFISQSVDGVNNVKIGDFGLATSGQFAIDKATVNNLESDDITRSIGTASYAAPEVRSGVQGMYTAKVDMYSLGIIFFEMCYQPMVGMQRAVVIERLRRQRPEFPDDFSPADKVQTDIVFSLLTHSPKERPSSFELLQSGKLPVQMESETIRRTLAGLSDPSSPFYQKMLSTLFARQLEQTKDYAWDMQSPNPNAIDLLNQGLVKNALTQIFRRHGAVESQRCSLYPRSSHYRNDVVKLLDPNGAVLQLPYDLTLGHARTLAKQSSGLVVQRTFTFGSVYRDRQDTGQPNTFHEVDFDIVTTDTLDLALKEAEVIKVLDEIVTTFPSLSPSQMCFHIGHSDLLQLVFEFCRVEPSARPAAAECLSKLNFQNWTWQKLRSQLRGPDINLSATTVDELQRFDFRDTPSKAFSKLKDMWKGTDTYERAASTLAHLRDVSQYAKSFGVTRKIYVNPLHCVKQSLYTGGVMFACINERKSYRDVFSAGGRYDSLIREHRPKTGSHFEERHAVGFQLPWEKLAKVQKATGGKAFLKKAEEDAQSIFTSKRCDVLVASFDPSILRSTGIEILQALWSHDISAEIARDARSPEDLLSQNRDENYSWIVIIKPDVLKIKSMGKKDMPDADIPQTQLLSWLRSEIRDRDSKAVVKLRGLNQSSETGLEKDHPEQEVKILVAQTKSKKFNYRTVIKQAQVASAALTRSFLEGPILSVETGDGVMDMLHETRLSDYESWRKLEQAVTTAEKRYVREIKDQLDTWRFNYEKKGGTRHAFIYNFRTGNCLYYDMGI